jgi:hypothetical protein
MGLALTISTSFGNYDISDQKTKLEQAQKKRQTPYRTPV